MITSLARQRGLVYRDPWWSEKKGSVAESLASQFRWLDNEQSHHRDRNLVHLRMYSNRLAATMSGASFAVFDAWGQDRLRLNVCQAVVDAGVAQAAANEIRPMPLTVDGNQSMQRRAKDLQLYFDGQFHRLRQHEIFMMVFQDAMTFGTGLEKVYPGYGRVCAERVLVDNIVVDDIEAQSGVAQSLFEYREVNRNNLAKRYPKHREAIEKSTELLRQDHWGRHRLAAPVSVIEAWKLPSYPGAEDGRHVLICAGVKEPLEDEPWTRMRFPFAKLAWKVPPIGWYGLGAIEELVPLQIELNYLLEKKQRLLWHASFQLWVKRGTVQQSDLTNEEIAIRQYDDVPPTKLDLMLGLAEIDQHIENLYNKCFEITGISQMQATAQKPAGLNSGEAQRVYNDTASARFLHTMKRAENFHLDVAQLLIDAERDLREANEDEEVEYTPVVAKTKHGLKKIDFEEVDIEEDSLQLQTFPTAMLPAQPAGKLAMLKDLGEISPAAQELMVSQLNFPDTEQMMSYINAPIDHADWLIEKMLERGEYQAPESYWQLDVHVKRTLQALTVAERQNAPEERLQLLRTFVSQCNDLLNPAPPPTPAPATAPSPDMMQGSAMMPQLVAPQAVGGAPGAAPAPLVPPPAA
jgi:hypothetical protein